MERGGGLSARWVAGEGGGREVGRGGGFGGGREVRVLKKRKRKRPQRIRCRQRGQMAVLGLSRGNASEVS